MKRFGAPPKSDQTYHRRPGVYAILPQYGGIIATYQGGIHNEYQLPGGGIDQGESPIPALHREVMEETGWRIARPRFWHRFKRFTYMPEYNLWAEKICTIYIANPVQKICTPTEPDHSDIWLPYDAALSKLAVSGDRDAVFRLMSAGR